MSYNPSSEAVHRLYGMFLVVRGRPAEAALIADRACELDPLCLVVNTSAAWVRYLSGDYDKTMERCRHTLGMDETFPPAHRLLAGALYQLGRVDEAIAELEIAFAQKRDPVSLAWLAHMLATEGQTARAHAALAQLNELGREQYVSPYNRALAHVGLGDADGAFSLLSEACDSRDPSLVHLALEPRFAPLRPDPRYHAILGHLGLRCYACETGQDRAS
jgi:tetratricopeptide (TPR) repeat protein